MILGVAGWLDAMVALFGGGLVCGVLKFLRWYLPYRRDAREEKTVVEQMAISHKVYGMMEKMKGAGANRVVLWVGHNCGGLPSVSSPFFVSALHWTRSKDSAINPGDYQQMPVDASYIKMMMDIHQHGNIELRVAEMPECQLRSHYEIEGVCESVILFLRVHQKKFLYLSVAKYAEPFTKEERELVRLRGHKIKNLVCKR